MPQYIDENGVICFKNNGRPEYQRMRSEKVRPDIMVLCTGYTQVFPFFNAAAEDEGLKTGKPYPTAGDADVRSIWKRDDPTIGFIGFVRPSLGAIPPLSEMQTQLWILNLAAPRRIPRPLSSSDEHHYKMRSPENARIKYGVDHESYVYQLALDMDSALGFQEALQLGWSKNWRLPLVWALSANLNTKFRLKGPWKWNEAEKVMLGEIWGMICKRRLFSGM